MAAGDNSLDNCPVCDGGNIYCEMQQESGQFFWVQCQKCSFVGVTAENREEARAKWNEYSRTLIR